MEYVFQCNCKCLFAAYIRDDEPAVAPCPLCHTDVSSDLPMRENSAAKSHLTIIGDTAPFRSIVDGSVVGGRAALREHNKRNDVVQVGNDKITRTEAAPMPRAGYDVKRALETARSA